MKTQYRIRLYVPDVPEMAFYFADASPLHPAKTTIVASTIENAVVFPSLQAAFLEVCYRGLKRGIEIEPIDQT